MTEIEFKNISKRYSLELTNTRTLSHDLNRFWLAKARCCRTLYLKVEQGDIIGISGRNGAIMGKQINNKWFQNILACIRLFITPAVTIYKQIDKICNFTIIDTHSKLAN